MIDKKIQKVLNPLLNLPTEYEKGTFGDTCIICGFPFGKKEREEEISKALSAIKKIIKEELPKKKNVWVEKIKYEEGKEDGYNECLNEIHKRLGI